MEMSSLMNVNAPLAMSGAIAPSSLPQTSRDAEQTKRSDSAAVTLNLSPAAQNVLSSQFEMTGSKPVPETDPQEGRPSDDNEQKSRDDRESREESLRNR